MSRLSIAVFCLCAAAAPLTAQTFRGQFEKHVLTIRNTPDVTMTTGAATFPINYTTPINTRFTGSIAVSFPGTIGESALDANRRYLVPSSSLQTRLAPAVNVITQAANTSITVTSRTVSLASGETTPECKTQASKSNASAGTHAFSPTLDCSLAKFAVTDRGTAWAATITNEVIIDTQDSSSIGSTFLTITSTYLFAKSQISIFPSVVGNAPAPGFYEEPLTARITGSGFVANMRVSIGTLTVSTPVLKSPTELEVRLEGLRGQPEGARDVVLDFPNGTRETGPGALWISNIVPEIEVNQGPPMQCQTTACIANHLTVVRVRLTCNAPNCQNGRDAVTGRLHVIRNGEPVGSPVAPTPRTMAMPAPGAVLSLQTKVSALESLNFVLASDGNLRQGTYEFRFEIDPRNPSVLPSGNEVLTRTLGGQVFKQTGNPLKIAVLVQGNDDRDVARVLGSFDYLKAVLPMSSDQITYRFVPSNANFGFFLPTMFIALAGRLGMLQDPANGIRYTHLLFFTRDSSFNSDGTKGATWCKETAAGPVCTNVSVIDIDHADLQAIHPHEIGHTFGFGDTYDGFSMTSPKNPITAQCAQLGNGCPVEEGFMDVLTRTVSSVHPAQPTSLNSRKRDLMGNSGRNDRMIDRNVWDQLYGVLGPSATAAPRLETQALPADSITVMGTIDRSDVVKGLQVRRAVVSLQDLGDDGGYSVELQDAAGGRINSRAFDPSFKIAHANPVEGMFLVSLPDVASARRMVIKKGSTVLSTQTISSNAPTVRFVRPTGGSLSGTVTVEWAGSDADGDALKYALLYASGAEDWSPVAMDLTGTTYSWDTRIYPGSAGGRLMIIANDGANEGRAISSPFSLPTRQPFVAITSPANGTAIPAGTALTIEGVAFDEDSVALPGSALSYSSNVSGSLGSGSSVTANLPAGRHTITLTASLAGAPTATRTIVVDVFTPGRDSRAIPVVGSTPGSGGSFFKTDVQIHNPTTTSMAGYLTYHPVGVSGSDTDPSLPYMLLPRQSRFFADFLPQFGQSGLGSADLVSTFGSSPLAVMRIFNDAGAAGTTGMTEEAMRTADALKAGDRGVLLAPVSTAAARFNIGVRTLLDGVAMNVVVRNSSGEIVLNTTKNFGPTFFIQQTALAFLGRDVSSLDSIHFTITGGSAIVYGSTTDNKTQDPALQIARPVSQLTTTAPRIIPVVGSAAGNFGSFFKTSVSLHNATNSTIIGNLIFHPSSRSGVATDPKVTYFISANQTAAYDDLVATMRLSGVGSVDLVPTTGGAPVVVARVFNDGGVNGTTGMTEEVMLPSEALKQGETATLIAPANPGKARFNIGVRTLEAGATITATLRDVEGRVLKTIPLSFAPSFFQQSVASQMFGTSLGATDTITFTVDSGSAIIYGSTTDNTTQDSSLQFARVPR